MYPTVLTDIPAKRNPRVNPPYPEYKDNSFISVVDISPN